MVIGIKAFGNTLSPIFSGKNSNNTDENKNLVSYINTNDIRPRKNQPRKYFNENALNELIASIKEKGIIQPIIVREIGDNIFDIVVGERRWQAARSLGLNRIPAIVKNYTDKDTMIVALMENIHRQDLNPIEEAAAIQSLILEYSLTHDAVAQKIGKARTTVSNLLRLLELTKDVRIYLEDGQIEMGHARALLSLDSENQLKIAKIIIDRNLSVRQTENFVKKYKNLPLDCISNSHLIDQKQIDAWKKKLSEKIHTKVNIRVDNKGRGEVTIRLNSIEDINCFIDKINFVDQCF